MPSESPRSLKTYAVLKALLEDVIAKKVRLDNEHPLTANGYLVDANGHLPWRGFEHVLLNFAGRSVIIQGPNDQRTRLDSESLPHEVADLVRAILLEVDPRMCSVDDW